MIVAPRNQPIPRCPQCGSRMKLWTIFLSPEILSFRCAACDETVRLIEGEPYRAAILVPPRLSDQRPPVVRQR
jgi:DNA-directed RNA polymerase subunit RPC12/RpoP